MKEDWNFITVEKCILELVLNSLNSKATAIAIRIDTCNQKLQVVDNGLGIDVHDLQHIGEYSTREDEIATFNETKLFQQGKSIISIRNIYTVLIIVSRYSTSIETYGKFFSNNRASHLAMVENRPSSGTTVTVYTSKDFHNWLTDLNTFRIRCIITFLALVNTHVSFSIRDDARGSILLRIGKHQKRPQLLRIICNRSVNSKRMHSIKIRVNKIKIVGFWGFECTNLRKIQQILLNLRPVHCSEIEEFMIKSVSNISIFRVKTEHISPEIIFFLLYIDSPNCEYNLLIKDGQFTVEFKQMDKILRSIEKSLRITILKESKPFGVTNFQPVVPPLIGPPIGRPLGLKRRRKFLDNMVKLNLGNGIIGNKNKSRARNSIENRSCPCSNDAESHRKETNNLEASISEKEIEYSKPDVSSSRIERIGKILQNENPEPVLSEKILKSNDLIASGQIEKTNSQIDDATWKKNILDETPIENLNESDNENPLQKSDNFVNELRSTDVHQQSSQKIDQDLSVKEHQYDNHGILWISQKCVEKLSCRGEDICTISDCSQWSDWIYEPNSRNSKEMQKPEATISTTVRRFRFLPLKLHALLQFGNVKFISKASLEDAGGVREKFDLNFNYRRQDLAVRPCSRHPFEVRLKFESLQSMKVLNQVNHEFIVAEVKQDDKRLLVIIDQHAMDERIRYESLLRAYRRDKNNNQFTSVTLHRPIIISDFSSNACCLLLSNQRLLCQYGVSLGLRNENTLLIFAVPRCFSKKAYRFDNTDIDRAIRKLLQEILDNLNSKGTINFLPFAIHDAIASEACHGAIKFGDPLTVRQCESIVSCWKQTEVPNRCAHGRPSVIPLLELSPFNCKITSQKTIKMDTMQHFFANVKSESFYLNNSGTRKLEICLKTIVPNIDFVFKLTAIDHSCHVEFSKDTWNKIVKKTKNIRTTMRCEWEEDIFSNTELRVFTEERHGQCALCFVDRRGERVNMMIRSFKKLMSESSSISTSYENLLHDIKNIAGGMATFIDALVAKCQQCKVKSKAYWIHLSDIQNGIKELQAHPNLPSLKIAHDDDYDDYDSDELLNRIDLYRKKRRWW